MLKTKRFVVLLLLTAGVLSGCAAVKPYQKIYLNHEDMKLADSKLETYDKNFQSYREGAAGANSGKVGGGCGCN